MPTRPDDALIVPTDRGLLCPAGGFYIDPWRPVDRAVVTHAHADHARPGSARYLCAAPGLGVLRTRLGGAARIEAAGYGEAVRIGPVTVTLHPAGHLLGSAQVCVEHRGRRWVVSGDYKLGPDATCRAFEPVACEGFITESTFGLPVYRWPDPAGEAGALNRWWRENQAAGRVSVVLAYALGKAQRVLSLLDASIGPIVVHGAVARLCGAYAAAGVTLPAWRRADDAARAEARGRGLVVTPPSAAGSAWLRKFGPASVAMASGWMAVRGARRRRGVDRGFVLSDHADWPGLLRAIEATGASHIGVTHGHTEALVRYLTERGGDASVYPTRFGDAEEDDGGAGDAQAGRDAAGKGEAAAPAGGSTA